MNGPADPIPVWQQAIRQKCRHPSGQFFRFPPGEIEQSIAQRFEQQAQLFPNLPAVVDDNEELTYDSLNRRANRLAHAILDRQGPGDGQVALLLDHSTQAVAAILGVLKAGRCYVPLDSSYPRERAAQIIGHSQSSIIVADQANLSAAHDITSDAVEVILMPGPDSAGCDDNPGITIAPTQPASIFYTSGSTGIPKGVVQSQRVVLHMMMSLINKVGVCADDRVALLEPLGFSGATLPFFGAVLTGASLCIFDARGRGRAGLARWLDSQRVTIFFSVPTLFRHFASGLGDGEQLKDLRFLWLSGEVLPANDLALFREHFADDCILLNSYGSTEATTITGLFLDKTTEISSPTVPVGWPIEDVQILLLDESGLPVKPGDVGEIAVQGRYLAEGYWQDPDLTHRAFQSDPNGGQDRIYPTGDVGRMLDENCLVSLGRKDNQVKVRGFRIEISEIESALRRHDAIGEVIVTPRDEGIGEMRLVAYLVAHANSRPTVTAMRRFLAAKLPDYMIPSAFVFLDALPLLQASGKVDRSALPDPPPTRPELDAPFVAPRTPFEKKLTTQWCEVLGLDQVGVHDNFFDLGGHSLKAGQLIARVNQTFHVELPMRTVFDNPTVYVLAQAILTARPEVVDKPDMHETTQMPLPEEDAYPLSFAQERMWFLYQMDPSSPAYNVRSAFRLRGPVDTDVLERAINELASRHEALRTTYAIVDGQSQQMVAPAVRIPIMKEDFRHLRAADREGAAMRQASKLSLEPFDLVNGPVLRAATLRLGDQDAFLLIWIHHIATDGWSQTVMIRELGQLYEAFSRGRPSPLEPLPLRYVDHVRLQRAELRGQLLARQLDYWKKQLADASPVLTLATDHPRPAVQSFAGESRTLQMSAELSQSVRSLSRQEGATVFMTMLAAFEVLLSRYSGQSDLVIGTPIAGRGRKETEPLMGLFVNTLALPSRLADNPTFRQLLRRVHEQILEAYDFQDLPLERLVEALRPERSRSHMPLFQVLFSVEGDPATDFRIAGVSITTVPLESQTTKVDIHLAVFDELRGLRAQIEYDTNLFDPETIDRMLVHFEMLLAGIVADPDCSVLDYSLISEDEKQLLDSWNETGTDYPQQKTIHELFEIWAARTPDAVAVVAGDSHLTYGELNARSNQLARRLRELGVGPSVMVAFCLPRSPEMIIAMLAALKAGGTYVPLDPDYPHERIALMLADTAAPVLLTVKSLLESLPESSAKILCLDSDWDTIAGLSETNLQVQTTSEDLAYVIYTSGSTGKPKGVLVPHRGVVRLVTGTSWMEVRQSDVFGQAANVCFDAATFEVWAPLLNGARLALLGEQVPTAEALRRQISRDGVTVMFLTSSLFNAVVDTDVTALEGLRLLLTGGEVLSVPHARQAIQKLPGLRLANVYGPTENTTFTTCYEIPPKLPASVTSIPIGAPISNTQVHVLDPKMQPVPVGVVGNLCISGDGLARGYLNQPERTAEAFADNPFSGEPGAKLYKTGDLARWRDDGVIEFLGRVDGQVKLRGFRVELGEVEAALQSHPAVRQAAAMVHERTPGDKSLVGYAVHDGQVATTAAELRKYLLGKLPGYMVPSMISFLDRMPLGPTGKIDRLSLPVPEISSRVDEPISPTSPTEETLRDIWRSVLGVEDLGIRDNFFDLGGHSLMAARMFSAIEKAFGQLLPLAVLFESPTIAELANYIDQPQGQSDRSSLVNIQPQGSRLPIYFMHSIGGGLFNCQPFVNLLGPDQPIYGFQPNEDEPTPKTMEALAETYVDELCRGQHRGPFCLAGYSFGGLLAYEMARQLEARGKQIAMLAVIDTGPMRSKPLTPRVAMDVSLAFLINLNWWLIDDILKTPPPETIRRLRSKTHLACMRMVNSFRPRPEALARIKLRNALNVDALPDHNRQLREIHFAAYEDYHPKPCGVPITLFRARSRPMFHSLRHDLGWCDLVTGTIEVIRISCHHGNILSAPHIQKVAQELQTVLDRINP